MSGEWDPVHYEDIDDPGPDPADKRPAKPAEKKPAKSDDAVAPVSLVLALPKEVTTALTMVADRLLRVALAVEENTKEVAKLAKAKSGGETGI